MTLGFDDVHVHGWGEVTVAHGYGVIRYCRL